MIDAVAVLGALLAHCEGGEPIPADVRQHLAASIRHCAASGDSLDVSIGLSAPGRRKLATRLAMQRRNAALAAAVRSVALDDRLSDWQRCDRLAPLLSAFAKSLEYRSTRYAEGPPDDWPAWKRHAWHALATDTPIPSTARSLYRVLTQESACSHQKLIRNLAA